MAPKQSKKHQKQKQDDNSRQGNKFRDRVFYAIHHLLLFKDISPKWASIMLGIQYLQLTLLTFNHLNDFLEDSIMQTI